MCGTNGQGSAVVSPTSKVSEGQMKSVRTSSTKEEPMAKRWYVESTLELAKHGFTMVSPSRLHPNVSASSQVLAHTDLVGDAIVQM